MTLELFPPDRSNLFSLKTKQRKSLSKYGCHGNNKVLDQWHVIPHSWQLNFCKVSKFGAQLFFHTIFKNNKPTKFCKWLDPTPIPTSPCIPRVWQHSGFRYLSRVINRTKYLYLTLNLKWVGEWKGGPRGTPRKIGWGCEAHFPKPYSTLFTTWPKFNTQSVTTITAKWWSCPKHKWVFVNGLIKQFLLKKKTLPNSKLECKNHALFIDQNGQNH